VSAPQLSKDLPMKVVFVFSHPVLFRAWDHALEALHRQGIEATVVSQMTPLNWEEFCSRTIASSDAVYLNISRHFPSFALLINATKQVKVAVPGGVESRAEITDCDPILQDTVERYLTSGTMDDLANAAKFLLRAAGVGDFSPPPPSVPTLCGILDFHTGRLFDSLDGYLNSHVRASSAETDRPFAALLFGRTLYLDGDLSLPRALASALCEKGFLPIPIFCDWDLATTFGRDGNHPLHKILEDCGSHLSCILNGLFSHTGSHPDDKSPFEKFRVPVFQLIRNFGETASEWIKSSDGLSPMTICYSLTQPEMLGCIEPTLVACNQTKPLTFVKGTVNAADVLEERVERLAVRCRSWYRLQTKHPSEKRIAVFLHSSPCKSVEATLSAAAGLNAAESTVQLLHKLKSEGLRVEEIPKDGAALIDLFLHRKAIQEFRWTNVAEIVSKGGALTEVDEARYLDDFSRLEPDIQKAVTDAWGLFPGKAMVHQREDGCSTLVITGLRFGNITVLIEPKRGCFGAKCDGEVCRLLHEPDLPPSHHFLATYFFLQKEMDAVIPMGAESPVEYLPGKRAGLSGSCFPEIVLGFLPVIYPYIMTAAGEGLTAKRRGRAVLVDHLSPPVAKAKDLSHRFDEMEELCRQYKNAAEVDDGARRAQLRESLTRSMTEANLVCPDMDEAAFDKALVTLPQKLAVLKERSMFLSPHVLGRAPSKDCERFYIKELETSGPVTWDEARFLRYLQETPNELFAISAALNGRFVSPGPSGHLSRGKIEVLPTGRNFFGLDLKYVPTQAAFEVGREMGELLLQKYLEEEGRFPETIGVVLWSSDVFRSEGELVGQILWLLGCRPKWKTGGKVDGFEVIPQASLTMRDQTGNTIGRPRIDILVQMSGVVRDTLPTFYEMIDAAVTRVAEEDEPESVNYVRAHVSNRIKEIERSMTGRDPALVRKIAAMRVFSSKPGSFGVGVTLALDASAWKDDADLAEVFVNWTGYGYGKGPVQGGEDFEAASFDQYAGLLKSLDVSYQKASAAEYDALSIGCYAGFQGGTAAAKRGLGGGDTKLYWGDSVSTNRPRVLDLKEEIDLSFSSRLLSPDWLKARKAEGYIGAASISSMVNTAFAWCASAHVVTKDELDGVTRLYIENEENRAWLLQINPYALEEIARRLLEAEARGLWQADKAQIDALKQAVLIVEGDLEDRMGPVSGEFQGGSVDILTRDTVDVWNYRFRLK
jgi:cobaltochelatase CobN